MRWAPSRFVAAILAGGLVMTFAVTPGAGATPKPKSKLVVSDPCTYLTASQVAKAFGGPVTIDRPSRLYGDACNFDVGPQGQVGVLTAMLVFPYFQPAGETARDVVESSRAGLFVSSANLQNVNVGQQSFVDLDTSLLLVLTSKKFAFSLQWLPAGSPQGGSAATSKTVRQLTGLAKTVVAQSPR
jgi:hypothetical protein